MYHSLFSCLFLFVICYYFFFLFFLFLVVSSKSNYLKLIEKSLGTSLKFHSSLLFKSNKNEFFASLYLKIIWIWKNHLALKTEITSFILSPYLWYNDSIHVEKSSVDFLLFPEILSVMFSNFLVTMYSLKNGRSSRENTIHLNIFA